MQTVGGIAVIVLALLAWGGQTIAWLSPATGVKLSLREAEADVEPTFWADAGGEARWDTLTLWTLVVAGALLALDSPTWAYFGLVGGAMYLYFAGRAVSTRAEMLRRGLRIGDPQNVRAAFVFSATWGVMAAVLIAAAAASLSPA